VAAVAGVERPVPSLAGYDDLLNDDLLDGASA
jgi:hypothetical protein